MRDVHHPTEGELQETKTFRRCVNNKGYPAALEVGRLYRALPSQGDEILMNKVRVVDESGESYLYPGPMFSREVYEVSTSWMHAEIDRLREENERLREVYGNALGVVFGATLSGPGRASVSEARIERLARSMDAAEKTFVDPKDEEWPSFGGSDPTDDDPRGRE